MRDREGGTVMENEEVCSRNISNNYDSILFCFIYEPCKISLIYPWLLCVKYFSSRGHFLGNSWTESKARKGTTTALKRLEKKNKVCH